MQTDRLIRFIKAKDQNYFVVKKEKVYQLFQLQTNGYGLICPDISPTHLTNWDDPYSIISGLVTLEGSANKTNKCWIQIDTLHEDMSWPVYVVRKRSLDEIKRIIGVSDPSAVEDVKRNLARVVACYNINEQQSVQRSVQFLSDLT